MNINSTAIKVNVSSASKVTKSGLPMKDLLMGTIEGGGPRTA